MILDVPIDPAVPFTLAATVGTDRLATSSESQPHAARTGRQIPEIAQTALETMRRVSRAEVAHVVGLARTEVGRAGWPYRVVFFLLAGLLAYRCAGAVSNLATHNPLLAIVVVIFLASTVSSVAGFAFSPLAGALVFHLDGDYVHAVQTLIVASIALQTWSVWQLRTQIQWAWLLRLLAAGVPTTLLGVGLTVTLQPRLLLWSVGLIAIWFGLNSLDRGGAFLGRLAHLGGGSTRACAIAGGLGGITGPLAGFPGCFATMWCALQGMDKAAQRGTFQPYILTMQIVTLLMFAAFSRHSIGWDAANLLYALPAMLGAYLGTKYFQRLSASQFRSLVALFLVVSGFGLLMK